MEDQRQQAHLELRLEQQLAAIHRKREERLAKRAREKLEDEEGAAPSSAAAADAVEKVAASGGDGPSEGLAGTSRDFGTPAVAPQGETGLAPLQEEL